MATIEVSEDGGALTIRVSMTIRSRGGRKLVVAPAGEEQWTSRSSIDSTLLKALVRAFRWRQQLDQGGHGSLNDIAAAERISISYIARILNLSLLSPEIVESILNGSQPRTLTAEQLTRGLPNDWKKQAELFR